MVTIRLILKAICIDEFHLEGKFLKKFGSISDDAGELKCHNSGICLALKGKLKTSAGYIWKYSSINTDL